MVDKIPAGKVYASGLHLAGTGGACGGMAAFKYAASEAICMSLNGPPCEVANAGMSVPALPGVIQVRQNSSLVVTCRLCRSGTMVARGFASWQTEQMAVNNCWPYLPSTILAWQLTQSPLNTACRSILAAATPRARSASLMGVGGGGGRTLMIKFSLLLPLSVTTSTYLGSTPAMLVLPARFTLNLICPFVPAGSIHGLGGRSAVVQPQPGFTSRIVTLPAVTLVKLKVNRAKSYPLVASVAFIKSSHPRTPSGNGSPACEKSGTKTGAVATVFDG